jgi:hypothetical protein
MSSPSDFKPVCNSGGITCCCIPDAAGAMHDMLFQTCLWSTDISRPKQVYNSAGIIKLHVLLDLEL